MRRALAAVASVGCLVVLSAQPHAFAVAAPATSSITLEVDARDVASRVLHSRMHMPAQPGPLTLLYPKWLPGEHGPNGPIADLAGLRITAGGKPLAWQRDAEDMYALHVDVPAGTAAIDIQLDYLEPPDQPGYSSGASATEHLALVSWNTVLLYPQGAGSDDLTYAASLTLPAGWKHGTALPAAQLGDQMVAAGDGPLHFAPASLTTLVDSPVLAGDRFRTLELARDPAARICIAADSDAALEVSPQQLEGWKQLVQQELALFGAHHFRDYTFLLTLSDHTAHFGLEHHECSDNRVPERSLIDDDLRLRMAGLLPHEMVHSWNGKYRRPAELGIGSFDKPMHGELLWVYEGLTTYLGNLLPARSGLLTPQQYRDALAVTAASMENQKGRAWRPLQDTAVAAQVLYSSRDDGSCWRRDTDFYAEGSLIWLEADTIIRQQSKGARSLDDFCRRFHGGDSGPPKVVPYSFEDIVKGLTEVAPYDWDGFFRQRIQTIQEHAPLGGLERAGWALAYTDSLPAWQKAQEDSRKQIDLRFAIGIVVREDGTIPDVIPDSPAAQAGVGPGMKLWAVNGRKWTQKLLREALRETKTRSRPLELLVENGEFLRTCKLQYAGGERYPQLRRVAGKDDLLGAIVAPRAAGHAAQAGG